MTTNVQYKTPHAPLLHSYYILEIYYSQKNVESVVRVSLYYQLQTHADSRRSFKISEEVSYTTFFNFCEKQLISNGAA